MLSPTGFVADSCVTLGRSTALCSSAGRWLPLLFFMPKAITAENIGCYSEWKSQTGLTAAVIYTFSTF